MPCGDQEHDQGHNVQLFHMDQREEKEEEEEEDDEDEEEDQPNFIYFSRHGESLHNLSGKVGGNPDLSPRGHQYAKALGSFINNLALPDLRVWVSEYKRTAQTAAHIHASKRVRPEINELNAGDHDELTYEQIEEVYPIEFAMRDRDKLGYRYPGGESYVDVLERLKPIVKEIVMKSPGDNLMIVSHQATLRCLFALLLGTPLQEVPYTKVPLHTIIKLSTNHLDYPPQYYRLPVECVDTFRPKPENCDNDRTRDEALETVPFRM